MKNGFFDFFFGDVEDLKFNTIVRDMQPVHYRKTDDGYAITCKTLGIDARDLKINWDNGFITVEGQTEFEGYWYTTNFRIPISKEIQTNITEINYHSVNGITVIYLKVNKPEIKKIEIKQLK